MMLCAQEGAAMHARRWSGSAFAAARASTFARTRARIGLSLGLAALIAVTTAGCSGSPQPTGPATRTKATKCGTSKTAADVPVEVFIARGQVHCRTAMTVVRAYAAAIRSGHAPGNGGGGPVKVNGWTCQGFSTPEVLNTGRTSKCVRGGAEILEILPPPPSPSAS